MSHSTIHAVIEYIKNQCDFSFDTFDVMDSPEDILNHYNIYIALTDTEMKIIQKELLKLAEEFQTKEMIKLYEKPIEKQMRWKK